jgi:glycine hydroxymethyltransferase
MAHISGLVAAGTVDSPFDWADIVSTTTHKTLRGPRAGLIFYRKLKSLKGVPTATGLDTRVNNAVFPACQGGPHENTIAGVAVALKLAATPEFKNYSIQVLKNCQAMASHLVEKGYRLCTGGTDNHLLLWDLRADGVSGSKFEKLCELIEITINKNSVAGDVSAISPGGVRLGSAALTTRGLIESDFKQIVEFLHEAIIIAKSIQLEMDPNGEKKSIPLKEFIDVCKTDIRVDELRKRVEIFASQFPMPAYSYTLDNF